MTLTEFLLARIAEDEREANDFWEDGYPGQEPEPGSWWHWVLADCEAKRRIVEASRGWDPELDGRGALARDVLHALALPYADHPDYDERWRP